MALKRKHLPESRSKKETEQRKPVGLRIIGGQLRGRKLEYSGEMSVRPMKDRLREAVFNLLGPDIKGKQAIDLFAGTGALGLEAMSRGAVGATFIERHYPTADVLNRNIATLGLTDQSQVITSDTFFWWHSTPPLSTTPWVVFCSPPYAFYIDRSADMLHLITTMLAQAPTGSLFMVESDLQFDAALLPTPNGWDVRAYSWAQLAKIEKTEPTPLNQI